MSSRPVAIIFALFLAEVVAIFETTMVYAALPTLIREFGDPLSVGWLVTSHMLVGAGVALLAGRLGDLYGRKRILLIVLAVAALGALTSAVTDSFEIVMLGRALQGVSLASLPLTIGILRESLPAERVPVAVGWMGTAQGTGTASGLVLGGALIDTLGWQWLFAASAVLLAIAWLAVWLVIERRPGTPPREPIDWTEGIMPVPAVTAVLLGISLSKTNGWTDALVVGPIVLGLVILVLWARRSLAAREPFIDLRLFAIRNVAVANGVSILYALSTMHVVLVFANYTQSPAWTMAGLGLSATVAGLAKLPSNVVALTAGPLAGWLMQRRGPRPPIVIGCILAAIGWSIGLGLPDTLTEVILLLCVISYGTAMLNVAVPNAIVASVPEERTSEAIGSMSVVRGVFSAIGAQIIALWLATDTLTAPDGAQLPSPTGFRLTMAWVVALTLMAAVTGLALRIKKRSDAAPEPGLSGAA